jgi:hypothetical protein
MWESYSDSDGGADYFSSSAAVFWAEGVSFKRKLNVEYEGKSLEICEAK